MTYPAILGTLEALPEPATGSEKALNAPGKVAPDLYPNLSVRSGDDDLPR